MGTRPTQKTRRAQQAGVGADWVELFDDWVAHGAGRLDTSASVKTLTKASTRIYLEMWKAFGRFCVQERLSLDSLSEADIERYLHSREHHDKRRSGPLSARYAWRMLHLIDRMLEHDAMRRGGVRNPASLHLLRRTPYRHANAVDNDKTPVCLSPDELRRLLAYLQAAGEGGEASWKSERDRAAVALMLGAGLTPAEMRQLRLESLPPCSATGRAPAQLRSVGDHGHARNVPLPAWAGSILHRWRQRRLMLGIAGTYVFPSTLNGKPWSHTGSQEACKQVLVHAGLSPGPGGLFRLRHSFALTHLRAGEDEKRVAGWLGYRDADSIAQYRPLVAAALGGGRGA
ncbi:site-specific integrase [Noviherbaspirillum aridicola]|uniref:Tyr recombinase domain-containing protein n=1 Tax=Noviherbaspirillum aridicola TaxID=2849687 RepID=A0ABQ4Q743_9BURK|nr:tyrosine-type recombinase/integrase [Noviherbaspirillum aridicola]GIZ52862.1 hypothetical protein NCCP691_28760 [Noviherbaspirillum aridicola]